MLKWSTLNEKTGTSLDFFAGSGTSGHAISGLANLQIPSLIAVVGFFIGGLIMTFFLIPIIFNL